jgi:hypothetical protein
MPIRVTSRNNASPRWLAGYVETTCPAASAEALVVEICINCALTSALPAIGPAMLVYSPYTGFTPASVADASPSGTLTTALTNPATTSCRTALRLVSGDFRLLADGMA